MRITGSTKYIFALLIFIVLSIVITYPLALNLSGLVTGYGDELVIAWIQNSVLHNLFSNPLALFQGNTYFPYQSSLAFSDLFLPTSILALPVLLLLKEPIVTFNFTFISSLCLLGFSVFSLSYYLTKNYLASLLAGILVVFSPAVLDKKVHLQILAIWFTPFAIQSLIHFVKSKKIIYFYLFTLLFVLQTLNSFLPGFFILTFAVIYLLFLSFRNRRFVSELTAKKVVVFFSVGLLFLIPFVIPYYQVSKEFNAIRDIRDTIHFALQPEDLIYPGDETRMKPALISLSKSMNYPVNSSLKTGYIGLLFSVLVILSSIWVIKSLIKTGNKEHAAILLTGITGLILSFGPVLHLNRLTIHNPFPIPLPYLPLYYLIPGFQGIRNVARWEMLFILMAAVVVAIFLHQISRNFSQSRKITLYALIFLGVMLEYPFNMQYKTVQPLSSAPEIYSVVKKLPENAAVIFLPLYSWNMEHPEVEMMRQYYSLINQKRMVNGYSGFTPPPWQKLAEDLQNNFPNDKLVSDLKDNDVTHIVVENSLYSSSDSARINTFLKNSSQVNFKTNIDGFVLYQIK